MAVGSESETGLATKPFNDQVAGYTQTEGPQSATEDVRRASSGERTARSSEQKAETNGKETHLPSIQSPASALADTLSALSLATPAVKVSKASRLQAVSDQYDSSSELEAEEPANAQEGDAAVGLVYDKIMEEHVGPPSKASPHVISQASLSAQCLPKVCRSSRSRLKDYVLAGHVERPQRTAALVQKLRAAGLAARCWTLPPRQVCAAHPQAHAMISIWPRT